MNIEFYDKLSNCCFLNLVQHEQHRPLLDIIVDKLTCGGWNQQHDGDWQVTPERPDWTKQQGTVARLRIFASARDTELVTGRPLTSAFDWVIESAAVDRYGTVPEGAEWRRQINGGFINHGDFDHPSWGSHT